MFFYCKSIHLIVTVTETSLTHTWRLKSHYQMDWWTLRRSWEDLK